MDGVPPNNRAHTPTHYKPPQSSPKKNSYHARALLGLLDQLLAGDAARLAHAVRLARRRLQLLEAATAGAAAAKASGGSSSSGSSSRGPSPAAVPSVGAVGASASVAAFDWDALQVRLFWGL